MSTISHALIKAMLISTPGSLMNGFNVGSWWFGKSLFYKDFKNNKSHIGHDLSNLAEISGMIQRQLVKWNLLSECDEYSNQFTSIVYNLVDNNQDKFWETGMPKNIFSIPSSNIDDFVSMLWFAANNHGRATNNVSTRFKINNSKSLTIA